MADDLSPSERRAHAGVTDPSVQTFVCVRDLTVMADIGVNADEIGAPQSLILDVELTLAPGSGDQIERTYDYRDIVAHAERLAARRTGLIETFAEDLARLCLAHPRIVAADVRVAKPRALPNGTAAAHTIMRRPAF